LAQVAEGKLNRRHQETMMSYGEEDSAHGAETGDLKKRVACTCVGSGCCVALIIILSVSAGGWDIIVSAGTEMSKCHAFHSHPDGEGTFRDVCVDGGTERAFTGIYDEHYNETGGGVYRCSCCGEPLFPASTKFDSKTGWPSFTAPIHGDPIGYSTHLQGVALGTEVHCSSCGAHLGHVFDDGKGSTGYRYCINSVCLTYDPSLTLPSTDDVPWVPNDYLLLAITLGGLVGTLASCCMFPWSSCNCRCRRESKSNAAPRVTSLP